VVIACLALIAAAHAAERRIALVIGNSAYKQAPLINPGNEARRYWRALSVERPDDAKLKTLAAA